MAEQRRNWTREETIVALNMFCTIPFNECSKNHPLIREVAALIGRSPSALNMKVGNFGRLDPTLAARGITGLTNGSALDEVIWEEFYGDFDQLALQSEQILSKLRSSTVPVEQDFPIGEEYEYTAKQRINQDFFRRMVLSSYNNKCCITGISNRNLIEACHIVDWTADKKNRTNPHNGLALTPTLHQAYDSHLLAITPDLQVVISDSFLGDKNMTRNTRDFFKAIDGTTIAMPDRFAPSKELLDIHYQSFVQSNI